ncbi:DUF6843 domain-containing protein [Paenibacillus macquariensis]|uniref:DUF6843 domain-containing protein n=1 Tax=Paenibacillus macquariensis TaxID=948756 RepID=A0ABY1JNX1_9BACL|nr:hypothetical protein [Paenibacillus macquariensis]MEC0092105.1 hypothetical protein [Paenibacillus macquariensis]OAB37333.1 hypothetical protein PMSM_04495 [Paenibacillus macquariensis subsp. macquariensis]SIQ51030.1 hypothetical protein SAMN05421578_102326 [Paenibacillus macquariensis]
MKQMLLLIMMIVVVGCSSKYNRGTYDLYLIPEDYEGVIQVIYNLKDSPQLQREGKYDVIPVDKSGLYRTSTPMYDYGTVIDQYYYMNDKGDRTKIDPLCVNVMGTGGSQSGQGEETHYTKIEVTRSVCGENFRSNGSRR